VLARTCTPSSGTQTFLSTDEWSKANTNLCVSVEQRDDGTKVIKADLSADFFYCWGTAWYSDCPTECCIKGQFTLRNDGGPRVDHSFHRMWRNAKSFTVTETIPVGSGHYRVSTDALKYGGYWRDARFTSDDKHDDISIHGLHVEVDVP
jgi:hypothetical protein